MPVNPEEVYAIRAYFRSIGSNVTKSCLKDVMLECGSWFSGCCLPDRIWLETSPFVWAFWFHLEKERKQATAETNTSRYCVSATSKPVHLACQGCVCQVQSRESGATLAILVLRGQLQRSAWREELPSQITEALIHSPIPCPFPVAETPSAEPVHSL